MSKVVYLLGAGASYGKRNGMGTIIEGLPIMNEIKRELNEFRIWFGNIENIDRPIIILENERPFKEVQQYIVNAIEFMLDALEGRKSIDCLAKDLYDNYDSWAEEANVSLNYSYPILLARIVQTDRC